MGNALHTVRCGDSGASSLCSRPQTDDKVSSRVLNCGCSVGAISSRTVEKEPRINE